MKKINHAAIVPLIGGFSLAATNITGNLPKAIFSFSGFESNDGLYLNYLAQHDNKVPYIQIDKSPDIDLSSYTNLDIIHGVPPCAGLSMSAQLSPEKRLASKVNDWMYKSAEFVLGSLKPKIYVFENAPGMFTGVGCSCRDNLKSIASKYAYSINFFKTDTMLHGIPQHRPRTYVVMSNTKTAPIFEFIDTPMPDLSEYLKDIPSDSSMQDKYVCDDYDITEYEITRFLVSKYGEDWRKVLLEHKEHIGSYDYLLDMGMMEEFRIFVESQYVVDQKCLRDVNHIIKKVNMGKRFRITHKVLLLDKNYVCAVIGELMERNVHPNENRRMNIREYMHLMGMPHDFDIPNKKDYAKLTQNTPVTTCEDVISECINVIDGKRKFSTEKFVMQNNIKKTLEEIKFKNINLF